jgi:hypothetical protein
MRWCAAATALAAAMLSCSAAAAGLLGHCAPPPAQSAAQHDRALRFAAFVKAELAASGHALAIVARSGLDLARLGQRYSHAGFALRDNASAPWSVRQLYFDCDEGRARIFDQGLPGFVLGLADAEHGHVSALLLPTDATAALARAVLDDRRALALLAPRYSANAYAFGLRYQNCNQWVAEMLAAAWSGPAEAGLSRADAQAWLRERGYAATQFDLRWQPWLWLALVLPWLHVDDHPQADIDAGTLQVSLPAAIEAFVQTSVPGAQRLEFCRAGTRVVMRRNGPPLADDCAPADGDKVASIE